MNKKPIVSASRNTIRKLKVLAKKKEGVRSRLVVTAKKKESIRGKLAVIAKQLAVTAKDKESIRGKLAVTAKQLAVTAKEKESVRSKLAVTAETLRLKAKQLAVTAKDKETIRSKLAITAGKLAATAKEKESVRSKLAVTAKDLARAKAKDDAVLASIGDGLVATDRDGKIILVNGAFEKMLGWNESEVKGKALTTTVYMTNEAGKDIPVAEHLITKILKGQTTTTTTTTNFKRRDGTFFPVALTASPIVIGWELIGAVEVFRDVTKERALDRAKDEFVSLTSHQMRTPLTAIKGYVSMLLDGDVGKMNEEQTKYLRTVDRANDRMLKLISALLNVSRIDLGVFSIEPNPTNIIEIAEIALGELSADIQAKQLRLEKKYGLDLPKFNVDPQLTKIIFQNLLSNAVKYTPSGGKVSLSVSVQDKPATLRIEVSDTGYGIPKDSQPKIFTKLFRADNARTKDPDGTGLGLYIVKAIVGESGGEISFSSEENKGTTFQVSLPLSGMKKKEGNKGLQ